MISYVLRESDLRISYVLRESDLRSIAIFAVFSSVRDFVLSYMKKED